MDYVRTILQLKDTKKVYKNLLLLKKENNLMKVYGTLKSLTNHQVVNMSTDANIIYKNLGEFNTEHNLVSSDRIYGELGWFLFCIVKNFKLINHFLKNKLEYEQYLINSNYIEADNKLEHIRVIFGYSRWYFDNKFLLAQLSGSNEENWKVLQTLNKEIRNFLPAFYVDLISKRAEEAFSHGMFITELNNRLKLLKLNDNLSKYFKIIFNSSNINLDNIDFLRECLYFENLFPIIDRFLFLKVVLISHFEVFYNSPHKKTLTKILNEIVINFPDDIEFKNINFLFNNLIIKNENNMQIKQYIEMFQQENYLFCESQFPNIINNFPSEFYIYVIYVKSIIFLNKSATILTNNTISDVILKNLFNIISFNQEFYSSLDTLIKFTMTLNNHPISKQILTFLSYLCTEDIKDDTPLIQFGIYSKYIDNHRIQLLNYFYIQPSSFQEYKRTDLQYDWNEINKKMSKNSFVKQILNIKMSISKENFQEAIDLADNYIKNNKLAVFQKEELQFIKFNCLVSLERINQAITLYINNKFENHSIVHRFNIKLLVKYVEDNIYFLDLISIEYIIFAKMSINSLQDLHTLVNAYIQSQGYNLPSEMLSNLNTLEKKEIYFFFTICGIDVLKYFVELDQETKLNEERLYILDKLIILDKLNQSQYLKEYSKIRQRDKIKKVLEKSSTSKITLNLRGFRNAIIPIVNEQYKRYNSVTTTKHNELNTLSYNIEEENDDIEVSSSKYNNIKFEAFKSIFSYVKNEYLSNEQFGLDGELSTRIRHGTLVNKLRTIFESQNLLFIKENNKYVSNNYWFQNTPNIELELFNTIMSNFSGIIDDEIKHIKDEEIQIYNKEIKKNGLFNFYFNDHILQQFYSQIKNKQLRLDDFINELLDFLTEWTKICLLNIKKYFRNDLKNLFNTALEKLKLDLDKCSSTLPKIQLTKLKSSIDDCRSQLSYAFKDISEWFTLGQITDNDLLSFDVIIQTAIYYINKTRAINLVPDIKYNYHNYDDVLSHAVLIDVFNILFENTIQHSGILTNDLKIEISISENNNMVTISVKNNLSPLINLLNLKNTFKGILERWNLNDLSNVNNEGNSGYNKIRRIINSYSPSQNNLLEYSIEEHYLEVKIIMLGTKESTYE